MYFHSLSLWEFLRVWKVHTCTSNTHVRILKVLSAIKKAPILLALKLKKRPRKLIWLHRVTLGLTCTVPSSNRCTCISWYLYYNERILNYRNLLDSTRYKFTAKTSSPSLLKTQTIILHVRKIWLQTLTWVFKKVEWEMAWGWGGGGSRKMEIWENAPTTVEMVGILSC